MLHRASVLAATQEERDMAKTSRKTAAKKKSSTKKKSTATKRTGSKPKAAARTKGSAADARKEYRALNKRSQIIWKDIDSPDAATSRRAEAAWSKFIADFEAWAKKYGLTLKQEEKKHAEHGEPTPRSHSANTHGCAPSYRGRTPNGNPFVCHFVRYSRIRGACIYTCGFDRDGTADPF